MLVPQHWDKVYLRDIWWLRVGPLFLCSHKCCFCPLACVPRRRRRCFTFGHSLDTEIWRVLTTTGVGKAPQGRGLWRTKWCAPFEGLLSFSVPRCAVW